MATDDTGPELRGRVGVLGDVHAEHERLSSALAALRELSAHRLLCVGDIADGAGDLELTCEILGEHRVECVMGNHDRWALMGQMRHLAEISTVGPGSRAFLESLPAMRRYRTPVGGLLLCHGVGEDDMALFKPSTPLAELERCEPLVALRSDPTLALMVAGHSHRRMLRDLGDLLAVNAGTLRAKPGRPACFVLLDFTTAAARPPGDSSWIEFWLQDDEDRWRRGPAAPELAQRGLAMLSMLRVRVSGRKN